MQDIPTLDHTQIYEYKNDDHHLFFNPATLMWVGTFTDDKIAFPAIVHPGTNNFSPEHNGVEINSVDPDFLHSSDREILRFTGLYDDHWDDIADPGEWGEEDQPLTDSMTAPFIKRHMINFLRERAVVVGNDDTTLIRVFRCYAIELAKSAIETSLLSKSTTIDLKADYECGEGAILLSDTFCEQSGIMRKDLLLDWLRLLSQEYDRTGLADGPRAPDRRNR